MIIYKCDICEKEDESKTFMYKEIIGKEEFDLCLKCSTEFEQRDRDTKKAIFLNMKREKANEIK